MQQERGINLSTKKNYNLFQKIFCLRCFGCMKADNNSLLTANNRKQVIQKMLAKGQDQIDLDHERTILDPLQLMILLFLSENKHKPTVLLRYCRLNINLALTDSNRTDVEFYIPQLTNYIVFHEQFKNLQLIDTMEAACRCDFYFAHQYYLYLNSLEQTYDHTGLQVIEPIKKYKLQLLTKLCEHYSDWMLYNQNLDMSVVNEKKIINEVIKQYGTTHQVKRHLFVEAQDIHVSYYPSLYNPEENKSPSAFKSMINFFQDLFAISTQMSTMRHVASESKKTNLRMLLQQINGQLPACTYIPFIKKFMRHYNILNILDSETMMFNTKQRCLFSVSLEVYNPTQIMDEKERRTFQLESQGPTTIYNSMPKYRVMNSTITSPAFIPSHPTSNSLITFRNTKKQEKGRMSPQKSKSKKDIEKSQISENTCKTAVIGQKALSQKLIIQKIFGESQQQRKGRIRRHSIYGQLKTWDMITIIVKTGDNLKQQQFALQLIQQFDYIFKKEKLGLLLTTYQVISMGPDFGIIQMVRDSVTLDKLYRKMKQSNLDSTISNYFNKTFEGKQLQKVLNNFCKSLAAYCVVTYLLQLKDRHNGNIMLHRNGKLLHIDFGFFLSNAPGKGVGLQISVPFKLNTQYIDALGGYKSKYFQKFRRYFFEGYLAARKHQDRILILIKMIYSSSGATMPCFEKGEVSIQQIQKRFNPPGITTEMQISQFCQGLINQSLDNWKTKWYDKWQYWAQGILY